MKGEGNAAIHKLVYMPVSNKLGAVMLRYRVIHNDGIR